MPFRLPRLTLTVLLTALFCASCSAQPTWEGTFAKIARDFPGTPELSTAELANWLADDSRPQPVLLDVREPAEFQVSHLRNAQQVSPAALPSDLKLAKDSPVVAYCSVGYRSSALVQRLRAAGYSKVYNLHGSLFTWANDGLPLYQGNAPASKVHPYNNRWATLLKPQFRHK
jgi:rhodanese-related sulfurtransferase